MQTPLKGKALKKRALAALAALALLAACAVNAGASAAAHITRCDLISHGMTVGRGRIIRKPVLRDGKACLETRLIIETKVDLLFYKFSMKMDETWIADAGGLIAYKWDSVENGRHKTISGELRGGIFRFEIDEAGQKRVWTTPRAAFDLDAGSQPAPLPAHGEEKTARVLDPSTCTIAERTYRGTGVEMLTVGQRRLKCQTLTIEYPGTHIRRWLIVDEFGPLILREDGRQKRGVYSRRAVSMDLEGTAAE